jgi:hypothetical protein
MRVRESVGALAVARGKVAAARAGHTILSILLSLRTVDKRVQWMNILDAIEVIVTQTKS